MTIKEQAYRAKEFLQGRGITSLKRTHIHELLASAVGYPTHAGFQHDATWCDVPFKRSAIVPDKDRIRVRCLELGLHADEASRMAEALPLFLSECGYAPLRFDELIAVLEGDDDDPAWHKWVWRHLMEPSRGDLDYWIDNQSMLLEGLEAAAQRGVPAAHFAIAKLLEMDAESSGSDDDAGRIRRQAKREGTWVSPFLSFAQMRSEPMGVEKKYRHHLFAAARSGDLRAQIESADRYGDPAILYRAPSEEMDPMSMADIAREHEDETKVRYWLTVAAQDGDVDAMRELILDHDEPHGQAWVWMHLSRLLDEDLGEDRFEAIHEDGSPYDDDVGGPAFPVGTFGIALPPLSSNADAAARRTAEELFARIAEERRRS